MQVLLPTFRRALALTLSRQFGKDVVCYSSIQKNRGEQDVARHWQQATCCLNSMPRIPECMLEEYDVVVIDECVMVMEHLLNSTMHSVRNNVLDRLRTILKHAKKVVFMQYRISERAMEFWLDLRGVDLYHSSINSIK
jgi:hypothetical protein